MTFSLPPDVKAYIEVKYEGITFEETADGFRAYYPSKLQTEELQSLLWEHGAQLCDIPDDRNYLHAWLFDNCGNPEYPMLSPLQSLRKDRRNNLCKVLGFVFFFSCKCGKQHTNIISLSQSYIARVAEINIDTVGAAIKTLEKMKILIRIYTGSRHSHTSSIFWVNPEVFVMAAKERSLCNHKLRGSCEYALENGVTLEPTFDEIGFCGTKISYSGEPNPEIVKIFPNQEDVGCQIEWTSSCYSSENPAPPCQGGNDLPNIPMITVQYQFSELNISYTIVRKFEGNGFGVKRQNAGVGMDIGIVSDGPETAQKKPTEGGVGTVKSRRSRDFLLRLKGFKTNIWYNRVAS